MNTNTAILWDTFKNDMVVSRNQKKIIFDESSARGDQRGKTYLGMSHPVLFWVQGRKGLKDSLGRLFWGHGGRDSFGVQYFVSEQDGRVETKVFHTNKHISQLRTSRIIG